MSKKKSATMTLRDFHGGNIPSDLPLPSAPGMIVERKNHDRPGSGGWMGSSLHRGFGGDRVGYSRQGSGNFARSYEEKMSYLPNPANIGRNYDEDERKPVDGHNRRGQSSDFYEEPIYEQRLVGHERLPDRYTLDNRGGYISSKPVDLRTERHVQEDASPAPVGSSSFRTDSFSRRVSAYQQESAAQMYVSQDQTGHYASQHVPPHSPYHVQEPVQPWRQSSLGQQPLTPGAVMGTGTGVQNVWTARRDGEYGRTYPTEYAVNDAATVHTPGARIAQASALEKVSSGRWNSRILQPNENQMHVGDYGQSYGGLYEGGSAFSPHNNVRSPADYDRTVYAERSAYVDSGRGIDSLSIRDARFNTDKVNHQEARSEQYAEGRGGVQTEQNRFVDDRNAYGEIGQKVIAGSQREPPRFIGSRDGVLSESAHPKATNYRYNVNEATAYPEARSNVQSNSGWVRPDPSPRREYVEGYSVDQNKGPSADFEMRGFHGHDVVMDRDYGIPQRPFGLEGQKEQGPHFDGPYHVAGQDDIGYSNSPYLKSRDDLSGEVTESSRGGRFHDRSRVSDVDQNYPGRLHSPGSVRTPSHESVGAASNLLAEEGKGTPAERPKLKLLPRTKPLDADTFEEVPQEASQESYDAVQSTGQSRSEGATAGVEPVRVFERPKLTLKPRSQPADVVPTDSGSVKERKSVFGGARPRELVLKERGVDESVIAGADLMPSSAPSSVGVRTPIEGNRNSRGGLGYGVEKQEKLDERGKRADQHEGRMGRQDSGRLERMDSRSRREHLDSEKKDERRGFEHRQHHQEKRESDRPDVDKQESWRRPVEVPQSPVTVGEVPSGTAGRPIQSAAELAQAFSRSTSFGSGMGVGAQGYSSQRSPLPRSPGPGFGVGPDAPGLRKNDMPFSRLTEAVSPVPRDYVSGVQGGYRRTSAF